MSGGGKSRGSYNTRAVLGLRITYIGCNDSTFQPRGRGAVGDRQLQESDGDPGGPFPGRRREELPRRC